MAESYQTTSEKESEYVHGMLPHSYTYAVVFERYKAVHDQLEKSQKKLEESQKQQGEHVEELKKEVQSLKEQKSQLKKEIYKIIGELETKVDANTQSIKNLESELSRAIESFSKSNDEKDILHRLRALEEKVKPSIEAYNYHDKKIQELEKRIKDLEEERENSKKLIKNLFDHNAKLNEQMDSLSDVVTMLESQQATSGEDKSGKSWWSRRNGKKKKIPVQDSDHDSSTIADKATRLDKVTPKSPSQAESDYTSPTSLKRTFSVHVRQKASQNNESLTFKRGHKRASSTGDLLATADKGAEEPHESLKEPLSSSRAALNKI